MPQPNPYIDAPVLPDGTDLDPRDLLAAGKGPIEIEIGPGRGGFLFERLAASPETRMIGLEVRRKWATIVDERLKARGLGSRGRVFAEDARYALPRIRTGSARAVFIHFPDPWWKKRHQKRLVATPEFLEEVVRILEPAGELFFQTDVAERADQFQAQVAAVPLLAPFGPVARVSENPYGAMSPRERRAVADGLPIVRLRYLRVGTPPP